LRLSSQYLPVPKTVVYASVCGCVDTTTAPPAVPPLAATKNGAP
jgi:hypothetical protein